MKNQHFIVFSIAYCLLFFIQSVYTMEIISSPIKTTTNLIRPFLNISFDDIPYDIKKQILKKILALHGIRVKIITICPTNIPLCFLMIDQYKPTKFGKKIFSMSDMAAIPPDEKEIIRKGTERSFIDRLSGVPCNAISKTSYDKIKQLSDHTKRKISVKVQSNSLKTWRICETTTCTCGIGLLCCQHYCLESPLYLCLGSIFCLSLGSTICCLDLIIQCSLSSCCKKYVSGGFKPQRKTFS